MNQRDRHTTRTPRPPIDPAHLVSKLTARDLWVLAMLHEHRVLTTPLLAALAFPTENLARRRLARLHSYGVLDRFRPLLPVGSAPSHWVLARAGATILAAQAETEPRKLGYLPHHTETIAHSLHLTHTLGINEWFTALATTSDTGAGIDGGTAELVSWWSQTRAARRWGDLARPDGYGRYTHATTEATAVLDFFLEYDLATTSLPRIAAKLFGFAELARSTGVVTPVLFWFPSLAREKHARVALRKVWAGLPDPRKVPVATAAAALLDPAALHPGPADRVWIPLGPNPSGRLFLHELAGVWPARTVPPPAPESEQAPHTSGGLVSLPVPPPRCPAPWSADLSAS
ncbi:replication-relaxation family protein [Nocardia xishanensis]|uniref:Replication-relaxation family protein n=1 Tax=Nocardia xishanensis TaxID=238964 RepID=A0ABW7WW70_9NOCA